MSELATIERPSGDYHVKITVKNGRLLRAIRDKGYNSIRQFCIEHGLSEQTVGQLLGMKFPAQRIDGVWRPLVLKISDALCILPEELFNEHQATSRATQTIFETFTDIDGIAQLSSIGSSDLDGVDAKLTVNKLLSRLKPREERVLRMRYLDGMTLSEAGQELGITAGRVRQLEAGALRKMRKVYDTDGRSVAAKTAPLPDFIPQPLTKQKNPYYGLSERAAMALKNAGILSRKHFIDTRPHHPTVILPLDWPDRDELKDEISSWVDKRPCGQPLDKETHP